MRYQIAEYDYPEFAEKVQEANSYISELGKLGALNRFGASFCNLEYYKEEKNFVYVCRHCGAELYGRFQFYKDYSNSDPYDGGGPRSMIYADKFHIADEQVQQQYINTKNNALKSIDDVEKLACGVKKEACAAYENAVSIQACPICGNHLSREAGFFDPDYECFVDSSEDEETAKEEMEKLDPSGWRYDSRTCDEKFEAITPLREAADCAQAKEDAAEYAAGCDLFAAGNVQAGADEIKADSGQLKKYISHIIHLENNIYALTQQLSELYCQRLRNDRPVVLSTYEPAYTVKAELEELRDAYQKASAEIGDAEACQPEVYVDYPTEPAAPVLGKPGLFNRKKVLEENEALTAGYQAEMEAYREKVRRCDEEKARLIAEKRAAVLAEAKAKADAAETALEAAERGADDRRRALGSRYVPAKAVKEILDKEIAEAEELLKKTFAARNELYAYDIIFGKYRDTVALSSFYEYLMSGRCTSLEGPDGAYNIYESEIRANRVIAQLDAVISSLEDIKQNQYMMYQELCNINTSLQRLNSTMDKALAAVQKIEANTDNVSEYMKHISQNTDVIAHNSAVTAYYSKVNAELTNALGYMAAFK